MFFYNVKLILEEMIIILKLGAVLLEMLFYEINCSFAFMTFILGTNLLMEVSTV